LGVVVALLLTLCASEIAQRSEMISPVPNKQELSLPMRAADLPAETLTAVICR